MRKRIVIFILASLLSLAAFYGCIGSDVGTPDEEESSMVNPLKNQRVKLLQFNFEDVTIADGLYKDVLDSCMAFYFEGSDDPYSGLTADDLLYDYRRRAGITPNPGRNLDWYQNTGHGSEHVVPQIISAAARYYAITKAPADLQRCVELADGMEQIIAKNAYFVKGSSTYMYEKILRAMMDLYEYCGIEKGYILAKSFVENAISTPPLNEPVKSLGHNVGDNYNEWYTMSQSLYEFADLAQKKGETIEDIKRYRDYAHKYEYSEFWDIFYNDENMFDYKPNRTGPFSDYFHAYSHVNTFNSALQAYQTTGRDYYYQATKKFYDFMIEQQVLPTGGYGVHTEYLLPRDKQMEYLEGSSYHDHTETQCNAYALVRLSNSMCRYSANAEYGHWTEAAFYNMTLASLETRNGFPFYYSDYNVTGAKKVIDSRRWMCCSGTRPLIVMEYLRSIYFNDTINLYVNLFTNSSVNFTNANGNNIVLKQQSSFPEGDTIEFTLNADSTENYAISFRKPQWLLGDAAVSVNGKSVKYSVKDGWISVVRDWDDGDKITLTLPKGLHFSAIESEEYEDYKIYTLMDGPVVLACDGEIGGFAAKALNEYVKYDTPAKDQLSAVAGSPLTYRVNGHENLVFKPFYTYGENELYYMSISSLIQI